MPARYLLGGQIVAEPIAIKNISSTRETLTIDLRPTVESNPALVAAVYQLNNAGNAARHQLLFASGTNGDNQFVITLDDTVLTSETVTASLHPEWKTPLVTPRISGSEDLKYGAGPFRNSTSIVLIDFKRKEGAQRDSNSQRRFAGRGTQRPRRHQL